MQNDMGDERLGELLMQRVTGALSAPEADALAQALSKMPAGQVARWERAAAELAAACASEDVATREPMPTSLAERVVSSGEAIVRSQPQPTHTARQTATLPLVPTRVSTLAWGGWMAAAAAVVFWIASPRTIVRMPDVPPVRTVAQLRDSLLSRDAVAERLPWAATKDSAATGASGDVVWSNRAQRGVMRIVGLQPNDRARWQYQLWIFDKARDQKYPVDGGVFDVPAGQSEVFVAIDARVPVGDAIMFAVTVERAGGVVVSTRERIALLAQRKS